MLYFAKLTLRKNINFCERHFFHVEVQNSEHVSLRAIEKNGNAFDTWEKTIPY